MRGGSLMEIRLIDSTVNRGTTVFHNKAYCLKHLVSSSCPIMQVSFWYIKTTQNYKRKCSEKSCLSYLRSKIIIQKLLNSKDIETRVLNNGLILA
jgi:hypothetical protein